MTAKSVRGVVVTEAVRVVRRVPNWRALLDARLHGLVDQRIDALGWYPLDATGELVGFLLQHLVRSELAAVRLWGRALVQGLSTFIPDLVHRGLPIGSVEHFAASMRQVLDGPSLRHAVSGVDRLEVAVEFGQEGPVEEALAWLLLGFYEELLTCSGAGQVQGGVARARWRQDGETRLVLTWIPPLTFRPTPPPLKVQVLLVDDEPLVARGVARQIHRSVQLLPVSTAAEALEKLAQAPYDVVLTEHRPPALDGLALLEQVRARWPDAKRVVHAGTLGAEVHAAVASGLVHEALPKPAPRDVLLQALEPAQGPG